MSDIEITIRLRRGFGGLVPPICDEAADYIESLEQRLSGIVSVIHDVENRCMAIDGPVTPTLHEITERDLRRIYELASGK